jgi:hypothetical protein
VRGAACWPESSAQNGPTGRPRLTPPAAEAPPSPQMRGQTAGEHLGRVCGGGTTGGGALENGGAADRKGTEMITPYFPRTQTGKDTLVWKLTPSGVCSSKSAYKHCFNNLALPANQRPKVVPPHIVNLLNQVWQEKQMALRVSPRGAACSATSCGR